MRLTATKTCLLVAMLVGVVTMSAATTTMNPAHQTILSDIACNVAALRFLDAETQWKCRDMADPCEEKWAGVVCVDGSVTQLNLSNIHLDADIGEFDRIKHIDTLHTFIVKSCRLGGILPSAITHPTDTLAHIDLSRNHIFTCSPSVDGDYESCDLRYQTGPCITCSESQRLGGCAYTEYCNDVVTPRQVEAPLEAKSLNPTAPQTPKPSVVPGCGSVSPGPDYHCTDGRWVFVGNLNVTEVADWNDDVLIQGNLNVLDGSQLNIHGLVTVDGNFTMDYSSIVCFTSFSFQSKRVDHNVTRATVNGCATVKGNLTLELSDKEITAIEHSANRGVQLLSSTCPLPIISIATVNMNKDQCKKVAGSSSTSMINGRSTLTALLRVDSSECPSPGSPPKKSNTWKIAVGVSFGIVALILVGFLIVLAASSAFRKQIQPYHGS